VSIATSKQKELVLQQRLGPQVAHARRVVENRDIDLARQEPLKEVAAEPFDYPHGHQRILGPETLDQRDRQDETD
jgi:hypothetical protein